VWFFRNGAHSHLPGTLRIRFGFCHKYLEKGWRLYLQGELNTHHTLGENVTNIAQFFMGGGEKEFRQLLQKHFKKVRHEKPKASRKESTEGFFVAIGFREDSR
jgi:hypothetical protein